MTEAIVAGAIAGAVAGALAGLAVMMASHGLPRRRGPQWRSFTGHSAIGHSARAAPFLDPAHVPQPHPMTAAPFFPPTQRAGIGPFDRFTDPARRALALAQDEAMRLNHNYIGTEHLLLGLMREGEVVAAQALRALGADLSTLRGRVEQILGRGEGPSPAEMTLSPRTKKVVEFAIDEGRKLGHSHVGTEHLLLGLIREQGHIATSVLEAAGLKLEDIRRKVIELLGASHAEGSRPPGTPAGAGPFSRFDDEAKGTMAHAQEEAVRFNHNYIGTEHLLLGLLRDPKTIAGRVLDALGVTLDKSRTAVGMIVPQGDAPTTPSELTLSPRTKRVLQLASEEARRLGHSEVTAAHLLLALVREGQGIACGIIESLGVSLERISTETIAALGRSSK